MASATTIGLRVSWHWPRWWCVALILAALLVGLLPPTAALAAASCVVSSTADSGVGTLRQCLFDVDAGGTITFNLPNPSTITITSSQLAVNKSVTITGPGEENLILHGNDANRIFSIAADTVAISGMTITHGKTAVSNGGGILLFQGDLTLTNVTVSDSVAPNGGGGGLFTAFDTTVTVSESTFTGNSAGGGGGIFVQGTATLTNCTISGNETTESGGGGGGLGVLGSVTITDSIISNNTAIGNGGGIEISRPGFGSGTVSVTMSGSTLSGNSASSGGGLFMSAVGNDGGATATLINSTVSGNNAAYSGGGIAVAVSNGNTTASVTLRFTTVTGNNADSNNDGIGLGGGGIIRRVPGNTVVEVEGSIVAGNRNGSDPLDDCEGGLTSQGHNLWGDATDCPTGGTGDQDLATLGKTIGQVLTPLANNGGPTRTHALVAGSPAIDRVPTADCASANGVDQRGTSRPIGAACDAGALESGETPPQECVSGFVDVPADHPACEAIAALTAENIIKGYATNPPRFGVDDDVQRAQVAAFLVRALQWQGEPTGPKSFTDFGALVGELRDASLVLANRCASGGLCVARGYEPAACAARGLTYPCFGPNDQVSYAQVLSFVARAFQSDHLYAWEPQPNGALPYSGVPTVHQPDARTYHHYAGAIPDAPTTPEGWSQPAPRAWIAMVLYRALQSAQ